MDNYFRLLYSIVDVSWVPRYVSMNILSFPGVGIQKDDSPVRGKGSMMPLKIVPSTASLWMLCCNAGALQHRHDRAMGLHLRRIPACSYRGIDRPSRGLGISCCSRAQEDSTNSSWHTLLMAVATVCGDGETLRNFITLRILKILVSRFEQLFRLTGEGA